MFDHPVHFSFYNCATIILISIQTFLLKMLFHCDYFFFYSNTIFVDMFKCKKYKKHIIQCFLLLHLGYI